VSVKDQKKKKGFRLYVKLTFIPSHVCSQLQQSTSHKLQFHSRLTSYPMGQ